MIAVALILSGRFHELAIPMAATVARLGVAIVLVWVAVHDVRARQKDASVGLPLTEAA